MDYGFDGGVNEPVNNTGNPQNVNHETVSPEEEVVDSMGEPIDDVNEKGESKEKGNKGETKKETTKTTETLEPKPETKTDDTKTSLEEGSVLEVGDASYTVDKDGNLVDKDGKIFKAAKDVDTWLKEFEVEETNDNKETQEVSIETIRDAIGIEITDDDDTPIEFDNTPEGIASYVNAVIETAKEEQTDAALNSLYQRYPIIKDVLDYYIANGNSLDGFNDVPDRSNITIDAANEAQQESIIKLAWQEQNRKGDVNAYIQYLKSSNTLLAVAQEELKGLQEADAQYRKDIEEEAERVEQERIDRLEKYWDGVYNVIKSRSIAGYTIPENIIIERNGVKLSVTPEDFFNYIYRVDDEGKSAYERELMTETPESRRDDEILRAYLKFVGGNYSNLVDMAISKEKVNKLKLIAKQRHSSSVKIRKPSSNNKGVNTDFGY